MEWKWKCSQGILPLLSCQSSHWVMGFWSPCLYTFGLFSNFPLTLGILMQLACLLKGHGNLKSICKNSIPWHGTCTSLLWLQAQMCNLHWWHYHWKAFFDSGRNPSDSPWIIDFTKGFFGCLIKRVDKLSTLSGHIILNKSGRHWMGKSALGWAQSGGCLGRGSAVREKSNVLDKPEKNLFSNSIPRRKRWTCVSLVLIFPLWLVSHPNLLQMLCAWLHSAAVLLKRLVFQILKSW